MERGEVTEKGRNSNSTRDGLKPLGNKTFSKIVNQKCSKRAIVSQIIEG